MRSLLDQDVDAVTGRSLWDHEHDVRTAADIGGSRALNETLLTTAHAQARLFRTRDRDFGVLVFVRGCEAGMIYLRVEPATFHAVHEELAHVLGSYTEEALRNALVVVEPGRHRFRRLSSS
jgi:predicted nuclease of predicted toxin-antitoxin system